MKTFAKFILFSLLLFSGCSIPGMDDLNPSAGPGSTSVGENPSAVIPEIVAALSGDASRNLLVLVNPNLMDGLSQELAVLGSDLRNENWHPVVSAFSALSPEVLRETLQAVYSQRPFAGIFLIGDFPYPRMWSYPVENPDQPGAADYYYMDLDGEWSDANGDGFYDVHSGGPGDRQPEVFVGRLNAGNVPGLGRSELEMVRDYLRRDHAYRTGELATRNAALYATYAHSLYGWVGAENAQWTRTEILQSIQALYPATDAFIFDESTDPEDSTGWAAEFWPVGDLNQKKTFPARSKFRELMGAGYDYLSIGIHGTPDAWGPDFFTNRDAESVYKSGGGLPVLIFSASCSTADLSAADNLGSILTMAGSLVFVGFSAPSEMRWMEFVSWNQSLLESPVGVAFLALQAEATPGGSGAVSRNVNWILLGDPTLRLRKR
jgi:Peptidase family C25